MPPARVDFLGDLLGAIEEIVIDDNARRVVRSKVQCNLTPDSLSRAGDQRHLVSKIEKLTHTFLSRPFQ